VARQFLDRRSEFSELEAAWARARRGSPQLAVLWGRRRVGKTYLLSHFARRHRAVFFGATQQAERVELGRLAEAVRRDLGDAIADLTGGGFSSWEAALRVFVAMAAKGPLAVVIDEAPYLMRSTPGFASIVQVVWDHLPPGSHLLLVLTGSAIGVIEELIATGALRGRPTLQRRLEPLDPVAAREFLPKLSPSDFLEAYAACGGYPLHLRAWDSEAPVDVNLLRLAFTAGGLLMQDAESILSEELSGTLGHSRILAAVGRGRTKYGEIANEAGQRVELPLETLVRAGFLRKTLPVGAPKGAHATYEIGDPYLSFWFTCVYANTVEIESGQGGAVLRRMRTLWQRHLGSVFEELARDHARRLVSEGRLPKEMVIGRWWTVHGTPCEVDVLGLEGNRSVLVGEARWQKDPLDMLALEELRRKVASVPRPAEDPTLALWSRAGVSPSVKRAGALGFSLREMLRRASKS
jgi:AAA+ ATPase superfamily predicted ATPase